MNTYPAVALLKNRKSYTGLFLAGLVNGIGDRFSQVAMLSLLLTLTGSGMAVGITMGIRIIPYLLLAPLGGFLAGKLPRKAVLMTTDLLRAPVALSFLLVHSAKDLWIIYTASFILAAGEALYAPVRKSSIPLLVNRKELITVNSLEQVLLGFVLIIGAISGGIAAVWLGAAFSFIFNAISFLITAAIISGISFVPVERDRKENWEAGPGPEGFGLPESIQEQVLEPRGSVGAKIKAEKTAKNRKGRKSMLGLPFSLFATSLPLQVALGFEFLVPLFNGMENVLISVYAVKEYGMGDLGVGLLYGAIGIGLSLSFAAGRFTAKRLLPGALFGLLMEGLLLIGISITPQFWMAFALYIPLTFAGGFGNASLDTLLMREIPQHRQGMVFGFLAAAGNSLVGLSMLAGGWLLDWLEPRSVGRLTGGAYMAIALLLTCYYWFGRLRLRKALAKEKEGSLKV